MPTGYTHGVQEGKITTLEAFAKEIGRAFLWQARDSSERDLIKLVKEGSGTSYHKDAYHDAVERHDILLGYTLADWQQSHAAAVMKDIERLKESQERLRVERERYQSMIDKVKAWEPPTDLHIGVKTFMLEQLEQSYNFDCEGYEPERHVTDDLEEYKRVTLTRALSDVEYHLDYMKKDEAKVDNSLEWVEQLLESVKGK